MNAPENNSGRFANQNDIMLCVLFYHIKGEMSRKNALKFLYPIPPTLDFFNVLFYNNFSAISA